MRLFGPSVGGIQCCSKCFGNNFQGDPGLVISICFYDRQLSIKRKKIIYIYVDAAFGSWERFECSMSSGRGVRRGRIFVNCLVYVSMSLWRGQHDFVVVYSFLFSSVLVDTVLCIVMVRHGCVNTSTSHIVNTNRCSLLLHTSIKHTLKMKMCLYKSMLNLYSYSFTYRYWVS